MLYPTACVQEKLASHHETVYNTLLKEQLSHQSWKRNKSWRGKMVNWSEQRRKSSGLPGPTSGFRMTHWAALGEMFNLCMPLFPQNETNYTVCLTRRAVFWLFHYWTASLSHCWMWFSTFLWESKISDLKLQSWERLDECPEVQRREMERRHKWHMKMGEGREY